VKRIPYSLLFVDIERERRRKEESVMATEIEMPVYDFSCNLIAFCFPR
jgi:hypothetical protein